jgi:hypothetical protein
MVPSIKHIALSSHVLKVATLIIVGATVIGLVHSSAAPAQPKSLPKTTRKIQLVLKPSTATPTPKVNTPIPAPHPVTPAATKATSVTKTAVKPTTTAKALPTVVPSPSSSVTGFKPVAPSPAPATSPSTSTPAPTASPTPAPTPSPPATASSYTSSNWSGYFASLTSYNAIAGSWTATSPTGNGSSASADSTWIGIGGVSSNDLIQIGTQNSVSDNGQVSAGGFYELLPDVSQPTIGMVISPGDSMTASIIETATSQWTMTISDLSNGQSFSKSVSYTSANSSAEWIEEDPSYSSRRQIPFDNFGTANFSNASTTTSTGSTLNLISSEAQAITMVDTAGHPIATPSSVHSDATSFSVMQTADN